MTLAEVKQRIPTLWRHYSSWCLSAIFAIGALQQYVPELAVYLPPKVVAVVAFCGLVAKLIPQAQAAMAAASAGERK